VSKEFLETIKALDGVCYHLEYHQKRLEGVLHSLGSLKIHRLSSLLCPPKKGLFRCRILYDVEKIEISYIPYIKREVKSLKVIDANEIEYANKYADRTALDKLFMKKEGCDDILIVQNGFVRDTSIANIAFFDGEQWFTPKEPLLLGTTRRRLLDESKIVESEIRVEDIKQFKKVALMNAMIDFDIIAEENIGEIIC
jgi:4-amino-4-deoxychorismate lyase